MTEAAHILLNEARWDQWAGTLDNAGYRNDYLRKSQAEVLSLLDWDRPVNFLDIGCGTGWAVEQAALLSRSNGSFYGIDLSSQMTGKAREKYAGNGNMHFIQANAEFIPLNDNFFDVIICTHSFHHYRHPVKALREMRRLLKPGGKVYILDPSADNWIIRVSNPIIKLLEPGHVNFYSTGQFSALFTAAGLQYVGRKRIRNYQKIHIGEK